MNRDVLGLFKEHKMGWSYWNYKNLDFGDHKRS